MKKLIASAIVAAAIALPAVPAAAGNPDAWWGRKPCPWGEVGTVIWHDTPATDYEEIRLCIPRVYPGAAAADVPALMAAAAASIPEPAGTKPCPAPYTGIILWVNTAPTGYREEPFCIHGGPGTATADAEESARAGIGKCSSLGGGYRGYYVWWYDLENNYHRTNTCVYVGP